MATKAETILAVISKMPRLCNQEEASQLAGCSFNSNRALSADQLNSSALRACGLKARHGSIRTNDAALNAVHGLSNCGTAFTRSGAGEDTIRLPLFPRRRLGVGRSRQVAPARGPSLVFIHGPARSYPFDVKGTQWPTVVR